MYLRSFDSGVQQKILIEEQTEKHAEISRKREINNKPEP
jgi:hypothetical protein